MFKQTVEASIDKPKKVFWIVGFLTFMALLVFPMVHVDVDPESMLSSDEPVRVNHNATKARMNLYDMMFIGVTNDQHEDGVFNPESLARIKQITDYAKTVEGVVSHEIMSPDNVDAIEPGGPGVVKFSRVMPKLPTTRAEALAVRDRAVGNPFLIDTEVSTDGKALAIYVPLTSKDVSWRVAQVIEDKIEEVGGTEEYYMAGLPLAEDQFGVEMFIQMALSAPTAMMLIGAIIWLFFRQTQLTVGSLMIAMVSVLITMGLFIGTGNTLHIMSSMIPIFIMPIAVLDSVHVISHFYDSYDGDRRKALLHSMKDLWRPMLFTSLTTSVGFASLVMAPIPPIQVFGLYTGAGIMIAWLLTMTLLPAYIMALPDKVLVDFGANRKQDDANGYLALVLRQFERISERSRYLVLAAAFAGVGVAVYGVSMLVVNDNPTKWFSPNHEIRKADTLVNERFAGSYMLYLTVQKSETQEPSEVAKALKNRMEHRGDEARKLGDFLMGRGFEVDSVPQLINEGRAWVAEQIAEAQGLVETSPTDDGLDFMMDEGDGSDTTAAINQWIELDEILSNALKPYQVAKNPEYIRWTDKLIEHIKHTGLVGKGQGAADLVKKINRELHEGHDDYYVVPDTPEEVMETYVSFQNSHDLSRLWHIITNDYSAVTLAMQLPSGDNVDVIKAVNEVNDWIEKNPAPEKTVTGWSGLSYINIVWQDRMVNGMVDALAGSALIVFIMMVLLFRSFWWGVISLFPLAVAITFIYGLAGWFGKPYDMPIAVISSLALGLSVDFAIHFMAHVREYLDRANGDPSEAIRLVFGEPARGIARNAVVVAFGFSPLLIAPLVPYQTVGWLMMLIMTASAFATFMVLPAILHIKPLHVILFPARKKEA